MGPAKFKAAAVHAAPVYMDKTATLQKVIRLIKQAGEEGIDLLVFPETFVPGYPYFIHCYPTLKQNTALAQYAEQSLVVNPSSAEISSLRTACRSSSVTISLGISERVEHGYTLFNSQLHIDKNGSILGVHRKLQPTHVERIVWAQGGGHTLRTWRTEMGYNLGGLVCWEHTMNGPRQALIEDQEHVHAAVWPAISAISGFEACADSQIEGLMKAHALSAQVFVICASSYVDETCLTWMNKNLGDQDLVKRGGGWSAIVHPFCTLPAGPHLGDEEKLVTADIDLAQLAAVKVWVDTAGHYKRPEVFKFEIDRRPLWDDDRRLAGGNAGAEPDAVERIVEKGEASQQNIRQAAIGKA